MYFKDLHFLHVDFHNNSTTLFGFAETKFFHFINKTIFKFAHLNVRHCPKIEINIGLSRLKCFVIFAALTRCQSLENIFDL